MTERIVTIEELLEKWREKKNVPGPRNPFGVIYERCANDLQPLFDGLREMVKEWREIKYQGWRAARCADQLEKFLEREKG